MTSSPKTFKRNISILSERENVYVALGLHPQIVGERHQELELFFELAQETSFIGEVGLDFSPMYYKHADMQVHIFDSILKKCSSLEKKLFSIHSVRSAAKTIDLIESNPSNNIYILHWFSDSKTSLRKAINIGCYFSINHAMMNSTNGIKIIRALPADRILLESDAPFVAQFKTSIDYLNYLRKITLRLSAEKGIDMFEQISFNNRRVIEQIAPTSH